MSKNKKKTEAKGAKEQVDPATQVVVWGRVDGKLVGYDGNGSIVVGEAPQGEANSSGGDSSESS